MKHLEYLGDLFFCLHHDFVGHLHYDKKTAQAAFLYGTRTLEEIKGKKRVKVCHISLSDIKILEKITPENKEIYKQHTKGAQKYKYNTAFLQAEFIHILTRDNISVLVTYDEGLFIELQKYM